MLILMAFRNLFRNYRRTVAVVLTVALGTAALFCLDGFNKGLLQQYREGTIHAHDGHGQLNIQGYRESVFEKPWEQWIDNWNALSSFLADDPHVAHLFPRVGFSALITSEKATVSGHGQGVDAVEEAAFFDALNIEEGEELTYQPDGMLIGKGLAKALGVVPRDHVKVQLRGVDGQMREKSMSIVGIFHTGSQQFDARIFRIPLDQAQELLNTSKVESVSLGLKDEKHWETVAASVTERFGDLEAVPFAELDKVYYQHSVDWLDAQFRIIQGIILVIVLLGIFNTSATAIFERKQEIGNLRANGESRFAILKLLTLEGALLGLIGAAVGLIFSYLFVIFIWRDGVAMPPGPGLTREVMAVITLQVSMAWKSALISIVAASFATLLAAQRIARTSIAEALRAY